NGAAHRCACCKRLAVGGNLWLAAKDAKVSDAIKRVEITKHRTEYDIDQRKPLAVEIAARSFALIKTGFKTREFLGQSLGLLCERRFIGSRIETGNIVENGRAEFDPGAMFGAAQWVAWMQRKRLRFFQIFEDHRAFENCAGPDFEHRRLAERRYRREPLRFVGEI